MPVVYPNVLNMTIFIRLTAPSVWRQVLIPEDYSFYDFRITIEDLFEIPNRKTSPPKYFLVKLEEDRSVYIKAKDVRCPHETTLDEREVLLRDYLPPGPYHPTNPNLDGIYGDEAGGFKFSFFQDESVPAVLGQNYPLCISGDMANPPRFCKTVAAYQDFLSKEKRVMDLIMYKGYDPEKFDPLQVKFRGHKHCSKMN